MFQTNVKGHHQTRTNKNVVLILQHIRNSNNKIIYKKLLTYYT